MIIVLGRPAIAQGPMGPVPAGLSCAVAMAAAALGSRVELVGSVGDDAAGDAVAIGLARAGVGHAALLRIPAAATPRAGATDRPTRLDAADLELALRYLADVTVLIIADALPDDVVTVAAEAATYAAASVIVLLRRDAPASVEAWPAATILEAPDDAEGPFAAAVARYAAALEAGTDPAGALRSAVEAAGWEPVA
jgi:hypothetical protein